MNINNYYKKLKGCKLTDHHLSPKFYHKNDKVVLVDVNDEEEDKNEVVVVNGLVHSGEKSPIKKTRTGKSSSVSSPPTRSPIPSGHSTPLHLERTSPNPLPPTPPVYLPCSPKASFSPSNDKSNIQNLPPIPPHNERTHNNKLKYQINHSARKNCIISSNNPSNNSKHSNSSHISPILGNKSVDEFVDGCKLDSKISCSTVIENNLKAQLEKEEISVVEQQLLEELKKFERKDEENKKIFQQKVKMHMKKTLNDTNCNRLEKDDKADNVEFCSKIKNIDNIVESEGDDELYFQNSKYDQFDEFIVENIVRTDTGLIIDSREELEKDFSASSPVLPQKLLDSDSRHIPLSSRISTSSSLSCLPDQYNASDVKNDDPSYISPLTTTKVVSARSSTRSILSIASSSPSKKSIASNSNHTYVLQSPSDCEVERVVAVGEEEEEERIYESILDESTMSMMSTDSESIYEKPTFSVNTLIEMKIGNVTPLPAVYPKIRRALDDESLYS